MIQKAKEFVGGADFHRSAVRADGAFVVLVRHREAWREGERVRESYSHDG